MVSTMQFAYACSAVPIYLTLGRKYEESFFECLWSFSNSRSIFRFRF